MKGICCACEKIILLYKIRQNYYCCQGGGTTLTKKT